MDSFGVRKCFLSKSKLDGKVTRDLLIVRNVFKE
jgi:hypothetical protein